MPTWTSLFSHIGAGHERQGTHAKVLGKLSTLPPDCFDPVCPSETFSNSEQKHKEWDFGSMSLLSNEAEEAFEGLDVVSFMLIHVRYEFLRIGGTFITTTDLCKSWANILKELCMRQNKDCLCQLWYCLSCVCAAIQPIFPCCKRLRPRRRGGRHVRRVRVQHQNPRCQRQHPIPGAVLSKCSSLKGMIACQNVFGQSSLQMSMFSLVTDKPG